MELRSKRTPQGISFMKCNLHGAQLQKSNLCRTCHTPSLLSIGKRSDTCSRIIGES